MNNILDSNEFCTGCAGCSCVCPVDAIDYKLNENGFFEAFVKEDLCINCGKCKKVCIKFLDKEKIGHKLEDGVVYSAQSIDTEVISTCTSGGIAYEISKYGIENGYKIVGVIYDYNINMAKTVIVDSLDELEKIKGSKYLQSNTKEAFKEVINLAKRDKKSKFIIFGTPCQIVGIKKAFEADSLTNEIIAIDLFCHGVPSYLVWKEYLRWLKDKHGIEKFSKINFRSKHIGWHDFTMEICTKNKNYYYPSEYDLFFKSFFDNILLNSSCFDCVSRKEKSLADIRLGDFWGWRYQDRQDGISAILIMTNIGKKIIDKLITIDKITILDEVSFKECVQRQSVESYGKRELQKRAFVKLKNSENLNNVIKDYRQKFSIKQRIKLTLKESTAYLPDNLRSKLRMLSGKRR